MATDNEDLSADLYEPVELQSLLRPDVRLIDLPSTLFYYNRIEGNTGREDGRSTMDICIDKIEEAWVRSSTTVTLDSAEPMSEFLDLPDRRLAETFEKYQEMNMLVGISTTVRRSEETRLSS